MLMQANDAAFQNAALNALITNPAVRASFQALAPNHGMDVTVDSEAASSCHVLPHSTVPPRELTQQAEDKKLEGATGAFSAVGDATDGALSGAGAAIVAYVRRMRRRLQHLMTLLPGSCGGTKLPVGGAVLRPRDVPKEDCSDMSAREGNLLMDIVITAACLLMAMAFAERMRFAFGKQECCVRHRS